MEQEDIRVKIGQTLKKRRIELGLSQTEVGNQLGVTFQQVQKYEKGSNSISVDRLPQYAKILRIKITDLFTNINDPVFGNAKATNDNYSNSYSDREMIEMVKIFKEIESPSVRKRIVDFVRSIVQSSY